MDDNAFNGVYLPLSSKSITKEEKQKRKLPNNLLRRYQTGGK